MARYTQNINPKSAYQLILDVEEIFADDYVSTNTTSVNVIGTVKHNGNTLYSAVWASSSNTVDINGTKNYPSTAYNLKNGSSSQIFNYTVPVEHNADGSKSITINWSFTGGDTSNQYNPNGSISITFTLQTIPRATKLAAQIFTINTKGTIKWTKASSTFKHTLTYKFGNLSGTIGTAKGLVDGVDWTPPDSFYQQMTGKSGTGTLYLTTYNGDTQIGTTQEAKLTINAIESEANPQISSFSVVDNNSATINLTGDNKKLVLTKSNAYATLKITTRKYATVKSITINGKNVAVPTGSSSNGTTTYNVSVSLGIATSGSFDVTVIDSRGYSKNGSTSNSVINYVPLDTTANFKRIGPTTGKVGLEFSGNYFNGSFGSISNSLSISYKYKKSTDSSYTTVNLTKDTHYKISGNSYYSGTGTSRQVITLPETFDYKVQYDVQLVISDKLTTLPIVNAVISKGIPIMWWNGEKVVVNGDLYIADENGDNAINVINKIGSVVNDNKSKLVNLIYPVGSIYMSVNSTSPATLFGGTWVQLKDRFLLGAGSTYSNGATGGSATHTLTINEMPKHSHRQVGHTTSTSGNYMGIRMVQMSSVNTANTTNVDGAEKTGGDGAHNNMPPYLVVYMWKRTA